jgi:hypothetical protein
MKKIEKKDIKEYSGSITVTKDNQEMMALKLKDLSIIKGDVRAYQGATITAPKLTEVKGYVRAYQGATITAPKLTSAGYVRADQGATITAPKLTEVKGYVIADQGATITAPKLTSAGGVRADQGATITAPKLTSAGDVYLDATLSTEMEQILWAAAHKKKWHLTDNCSDWILAQKGSIEYKINNISFSKKLFDSIRNGKLSAQEIFALTNMEQRRVAYEKMDKAKMKELPEYQILSIVQDDGHGYEMKVISFSVAGYPTPFLFLNCFCPSTGREYFLETRETDCRKAKATSFGFNEITFDQEW